MSEQLTSNTLLTQLEAWIASPAGQKYGCVRQYPNPRHAIDYDPVCAGCLIEHAALELRKRGAPETNARIGAMLCVHCGKENRVRVEKETASETPAPLRVRLLKDIYDDGQDHHPPGHIGHKGDLVVIHSIQTAVVSHNGTGHGFVVHDGELELQAADVQTAHPTIFKDEHFWQTVEQRPAFEAWAKDTGLDLTRGTGIYMNDATRSAWMGWSAHIGHKIRPEETTRPSREYVCDCDSDQIHVCNSTEAKTGAVPSTCRRVALKANAELCPHGMPIAENTCGPYSKGEPNRPPTCIDCIELKNALAAAVGAANEARECLDRDQDVRALKIMTALSGHLPKYRADTDRIHDVLTRAVERFERMPRKPQIRKACLPCIDGVPIVKFHINERGVNRCLSDEPWRDLTPEEQSAIDRAIAERLGPTPKA